MAGGLLVVDPNKLADEIDALMKRDNALAVFAYNRVVASAGLQHYQTQRNEDNGPRLDKFMKLYVLPSLGPAEAAL
jgi:hypothetical protein